MLFSSRLQGSRGVGKATRSLVIMFIKSIVVDGFKSYGQRTEINGFDPAFNAITGLNGSGKSNILDAICFVLGITNLTHVGRRDGRKLRS